MRDGGGGRGYNNMFWTISGFCQMTGWPVSHVSLPLALFINRKRKRQPLYLITGEIIPYLGC